jgi:hypothetical protein
VVLNWKEFILFDLIKGIIAGNLQSRKEKESERWRLPGGEVTRAHE